jgi:hypothetical protein
MPGTKHESKSGASSPLRQKHQLTNTASTHLTHTPQHLADSQYNPVETKFPAINHNNSNAATSSTTSKTTAKTATVTNKTSDNSLPAVEAQKRRKNRQETNDLSDNNQRKPSKAFTAAEEQKMAEETAAEAFQAALSSQTAPSSSNSPNSSPPPAASLPFSPNFSAVPGTDPLAAGWSAVSAWAPAVEKSIKTEKNADLEAEREKNQRIVAEKAKQAKLQGVMQARKQEITAEKERKSKLEAEQKSLLLTKKNRPKTEEETAKDREIREEKLRKAQQRAEWQAKLSQPKQQSSLKNEKNEKASHGTEKHASQKHKQRSTTQSSSATSNSSNINQNTNNVSHNTSNNNNNINTNNTGGNNKPNTKSHSGPIKQSPHSARSAQRSSSNSSQFIAPLALFTALPTDLLRLQLEKMKLLSLGIETELKQREAGHSQAETQKNKENNKEDKDKPDLKRNKTQGDLHNSTNPHTTSKTSNSSDVEVSAQPVHAENLQKIGEKITKNHEFLAVHPQESIEESSSAQIVEPSAPSLQGTTEILEESIVSMAAESYAEENFEATANFAEVPEENCPPPQENQPKLGENERKSADKAVNSPALAVLPIAAPSTAQLPSNNSPQKSPKSQRSKVTGTGTALGAAPEQPVEITENGEFSGGEEAEEGEDSEDSGGEGRRGPPAAPGGGQDDEFLALYELEHAKYEREKAERLRAKKAEENTQKLRLAAARKKAVAEGKTLQPNHSSSNLEESKPINLTVNTKGESVETKGNSIVVSPQQVENLRILKQTAARKASMNTKEGQNSPLMSPTASLTPTQAAAVTKKQLAEAELAQLMKMREEKLAKSQSSTKPQTPAADYADDFEM